MVKRSFTYHSKDIMLQLYKHLIRPHLEYAVQAWHPWLQKDIDLLEKVQRRITKTFSGLHNISYEERLRVLGLTTLKQRRIRGDMIQVFKILNGYDSCDISLSPSNASHTRGHSNKLQMHHCRLNIRKYQFANRVINNWNNLPQYVISSTSVNQFKKNIDQHYTI